MYFSKEQIQFARRANLYEYVQKKFPGRFKRIGQKCLCCVDDTSIYIKAGISGYNDFGSSDHGNSIDFLTRYLGFSFNEAVMELINFDAPVIAIPPEHPYIDKTTLSAPGKDVVFPEPAAPPYRCVYAYMKSRGIPGRMTSALFRKGLLYQDAQHSNAVFINAERDYCEIRGTNTYAARPFHGCVKTASNKFWYVLKGSKPPECAYICEAAIDAISLMILQSSIDVSAAYISIGGVSNQKTIDRIKTRIKSVLAVDNDKAGEECRQRNEDMNYIIPKGKDWNDDLNDR